MYDLGAAGLREPPGWVAANHQRGASGVNQVDGAWRGAGTPYSSVGTSTAEISLLILNPSGRCATSPFWVSAPPTISMWLLVYILSYKSVQLVFKWLSRVTVLWFTCNFDAVLGGSKHRVYLLHHHDQKFLTLIFFFFLTSDILSPVFHSWSVMGLYGMGIFPVLWGCVKPITFSLMRVSHTQPSHIYIFLLSSLS